MEKHVKNYDAFTATNQTAEHLARASKIDAHEVSSENKTEAEKLKDEKVEEVERESDSIDATEISANTSENMTHIDSFFNFREQ